MKNPVMLCKKTSAKSIVLDSTDHAPTIATLRDLRGVPEYLCENFHVQLDFLQELQQP
jgi:hypothetical protein